MNYGLVAVIAVAVLGLTAIGAQAGIVSNASVPTAVWNWSNLAQKYAQINGILDPEEILAVIWNESTGNPQASNPGDPSWGLMGVTLPIGKYYAGASSPDALFDPETNIRAGSAFLADLKSKYSGDYPNDWPDAYNVGETKFLQGVRSPTKPTYSQRFFSHLEALG